MTREITREEAIEIIKIEKNVLKETHRTNVIEIA